MPSILAWPRRPARGTAHGHAPLAPRAGWHGTRHSRERRALPARRRDRLELDAVLTTTSKCCWRRQTKVGGAASCSVAADPQRRSHPGRWPSDQFAARGCAPTPISAEPRRVEIVAAAGRLVRRRRAQCVPGPGPAVVAPGDRRQERLAPEVMVPPAGDAMPSSTAHVVPSSRSTRSAWPTAWIGSRGLSRCVTSGPCGDARTGRRPARRGRRRPSARSSCRPRR